MEQANILEPLYVRQIRQDTSPRIAATSALQQNLAHSRACEMASALAGCIAAAAAFLQRSRSSFSCSPSRVFTR